MTNTVAKPDRDGIVRGVRLQCSALTAAGRVCGGFARKGTEPPVCGRHDPAGDEQPHSVSPLKRALRTGDPKSVMSATVLIALDVGEGRLSPRAAQAMKGALDLWLRAWRQHDLEAQLERLKAKVQQGSAGADIVAGGMARAPGEARPDEYTIERRED